MNLRRSLTGLALTLTLSASLLAGCGSTADKASQSVTPTVPQTTQTIQSAPGAEAFDQAALIQALEDISSIGPGASGSSLRAVKAANELVVFAANSWTDDQADAIGDAVWAWFEPLDEDAREEFHQGRELAEVQAIAITKHCEDPDLIGAQEDAGVEPVTGVLDLSHTEDLLRTIRSSTGWVTETDSTGSLPDGT